MRLCEQYDMYIRVVQCFLFIRRSANETLPLESSPNFTDRTIGEPILDVILQPGDMLYFPRGTIHQVRIGTLLTCHPQLDMASMRPSSACTWRVQLIQ